MVVQFLGLPHHKGRLQDLLPVRTAILLGTSFVFTSVILGFISIKLYWLPFVQSSAGYPQYRYYRWCVSTTLSHFSASISQ